MAKKDSMQEEVERTEGTGEQMDLIEIGPENAKKIVEAAQLYKKYQTARISNGNKETAQKAKVLQLVKDADLQPLEDGKIKFKCENFTISAKPRDFLITITDDSEE